LNKTLTGSESFPIGRGLENNFGAPTDVERPCVSHQKEAMRFLLANSPVWPAKKGKRMNRPWVSRLLADAAAFALCLPAMHQIRVAIRAEVAAQTLHQACAKRHTTA